MKVFSNRKLEIFESVYLNGSISAAARELGLTQPTVSQHLRNLEGDAGLSLFRLVSGRLQPTLQAHKLFEMSSRATAHLASLDDVLVGMGQGEQTRLNIIVVPNLAPDLISEIVSTLVSEYPAISLSVAVSGIFEQLEHIRNGAMDIGISGALEQIPDMELIELATNKLVCIAHKDHQVAKQATVSLKQVCKESFILPSRTGPMGKVLFKELAAIGIAPSTRVVAHTSHWVSSFVKKQKSMGVVDLFTAKTSRSEDVAIVPLDVNIEFPIQAVRKKNEPDSIYINRMIELARLQLKNALEESN